MLSDFAKKSGMAAQQALSPEETKLIEQVYSHEAVQDMAPFVGVIIAHLVKKAVPKEHILAFFELNAKAGIAAIQAATKT